MEPTNTTPIKTRGGWKLSQPAKPKGNIVLTTRDLSMMHDLFIERFKHANHFKVLYGGEKAARRLLDLAQHEFILRSPAAWIWRLHQGGGSKPQVYELTQHGALALAEAGIIPWDKARQWGKNRRAKATSLFLPHTLAVADVRTAFRLACLKRGLTFIPGERLVSSGSARILDIPGRTSPMFTDDTFAIARSGKEPALFFVEVDRDTEPNQAGISTRERGEDEFGELAVREVESIGRKFAGFFSYARAQKQREQFGIKNFRVLLITTGGEQKMGNLVNAIQIATHGVEAKRYLTSNFAALTRFDALDAPWMDAMGSVASLQL